MSLSSILARKAEESKAAAVTEPGQTPPDNDTDTDSVIEEEEFFIPPGAYHSTRIKRLFRANGRAFNPDENGYYVTDEPELIAQLDYFVSKGMAIKGAEA